MKLYFIGSILVCLCIFSCEEDKEVFPYTCHPDYFNNTIWDVNAEFRSEDNMGNLSTSTYTFEYQFMENNEIAILRDSMRREGEWHLQCSPDAMQITTPRYNWPVEDSIFFWYDVEQVKIIYKDDLLKFYNSLAEDIDESNFVFTLCKR